MIENLNIKERLLLNHIRYHYLISLETSFTIPLFEFDRYGIKSETELKNLLTALTIRKYLTYKINYDTVYEIYLTEKALNVFNEC